MSGSIRPEHSHDSQYKLDTKNGGMLSHATIVAREMNFPVLVGVDIGNEIFSEHNNISVSKLGEIKVIE